jgi:hypothetical protein
MSTKLGRRPAAGQEIAATSLVAILACALASEALASRSPAAPGARERDLAARVATIVERISLGEPTLIRGLPPERTIMAWRNR